MEEQKGFLTQLQELDEPRKKRWAWGLSFFAVFAVLAMGWFGFTSLIQGTSVQDKGNIPFGKDIPVLEALRGSAASMGVYIKKGAAHAWRKLTTPRIETVIPASPQ